MGVYCLDNLLCHRKAVYIRYCNMDYPETWDGSNERYNYMFSTNYLDGN